MTEEVDAIINNLSERFSSLTSTIEEWKHPGVKFPDDGKILPDLLDWEAGLPEIESAVEIHLRALIVGGISQRCGLISAEIPPWWEGSIRLRNSWIW